MPELPWNVLWERFGRFLELTYVVTTICGLIIAAEVAAIFSSGTPEYKQDLVASYISRFPPGDLNVFTVLGLALLIVIFAYLIGYSARALFVTIYGQLTRLAISIRYLVIELAYRTSYRRRRGPPGTSPGASSRFERALMSLNTLYEGYHAYVSKWREFRDQYLPALRSPVLEPEMVWNLLVGTYGETDVKRVLSKHPIGTDFQNVDRDFKTSGDRGFPPSMDQVYEYCSAWLKRYAPDINPPQDFSRWGLRYTGAVPIILAPAAYSSLFENSLIADHPRIFTLVALAFTLWMVRPPQTQVRSLPPLVFQRFVMAQFLSETRPQDGPPGNQATLGATAKAQDSSDTEEQRSP